MKVSTAAAVLACAWQAFAWKPFTGSDGFPSYEGLLASVHPDYSLSSLLPTGRYLRIAGMDWLPNGDMAVLAIQDTVFPIEGGGKGWVHIISGARGAPAAAPTIREYFSGFAMPIGLAALGDTVYVSQPDALLRLVDSDRNGSADTVDTAAAFPGLESGPWGKWAMAAVKSGGRIYTGLGADHDIDDSGACLPAPQRGAVHVTDAEGHAETYGRGLREPNGVAVDAQGRIFATDNDGEWVPANRLVHVVKDRFYGVVKCEHWDASLVNAPTAVWFPMHLHSPGQPVFISQGVYRGQLLVGDYDALNLSRIFLEQVNGEFQGALFPFSGGLASGGMRLLADGEDFYVGELAVYSHDGWSMFDTPRKPGGLEKLSHGTARAFEMLAIRALPGGFEIEFTRPAGALAGAASSYRLEQWHWTTSFRYGSMPQELEVLHPAKAVLSGDGLRVALEVPGLKAGDMVRLQLHRDLKSSEGASPWAYEAWYTLNAIPAGNPVQPPGGRIPPATLAPRFAGRVVVALRAYFPGDYRLDVTDLRGRELLSGKGRGAREFPFASPLAAVAYQARIQAGGKSSVFVFRSR